MHYIETQSNDFLRDIWRPRPFISAGGYHRELALETAEKKGDLIAFGRSYIGNVSSWPYSKMNLAHQRPTAGFAVASTGEHSTHKGES